MGTQGGSTEQLQEPWSEGTLTRLHTSIATQDFVALGRCLPPVRQAMGSQPWRGARVPSDSDSQLSWPYGWTEGSWSVAGRPLTWMRDQAPRLQAWCPGLEHTSFLPSFLGLRPLKGADASLCGNFCQTIMTKKRQEMPSRTWAPFISGLDPPPIGPTL